MPRPPPRSLRWLLAAAIAAMPLTAISAEPPPAKPAAVPSAAAAPAQPLPAAQPALAAGLYMERLADCMPCHTRPGGTPFAGGRELATPFGTLSTPNITPDKDTGIGGWTDEQFYRALHDGLGHNGEYLYPVMPYTSYTKMYRTDVLAVKAYLASLQPVFAPRAPSHMGFPFDIRSTLFVWRELFFTPGTFKPRADRSAVWNRGAYLVEGPGHCGECHSPRNALGAPETRDALAGGYVQQWLAPDITSDSLDAVGRLPVAAIEHFLRRGASHSMGVAFGPMAEVVHDSLHYATDADIHAIAVFLKEVPARPPPLGKDAATLADLKHGQQIYLANCALCHQDNGRGIPGVVPNLAGNAAVAMRRPNDDVVAVLQGLHGVGGYGQMPAFAGVLADTDIADVLDYVRDTWNNAATNVTPAMVAGLRGRSAIGPAGTEAARDFGCPKVGSTMVPGTQASGADARFLQASSVAELDKKIAVLIARLRKQNPGISDAQLVDTLNAAYCPAVANMTIPVAEKRSMLVRLNDRVQRKAVETSAAGERVPVTLSLTPGVAQDLNAEAAAHHQSASAFLAGIIARGIKPAPK